MLNRQPVLWLQSWWLLLLCLLLPQLLPAATATLNIDHLPLREAEAAVRSQLSEHGTITSLPSQQMLIISDAPQHIQAARQLLKQLDVAAPQYSLHLAITSVQSKQFDGIDVSASLPGGWIKLKLFDQAKHVQERHSFDLRLSANREGVIETGTLQPHGKNVRKWLAGYGIISIHSAELVSLTSGFIATVRPAGDDLVHIRIEPWMHSQQNNAALSGQAELLIDLGTTDSPIRAPSSHAPIRLNAHPHISGKSMIEIAGAATELTIPLGETVTIAANESEAKMLGEALLASGSKIGSNRFAIKLQVKRH